MSLIGYAIMKGRQSRIVNRATSIEATTTAMEQAEAAVSKIMAFLLNSIMAVHLRRLMTNYQLVKWSFEKSKYVKVEIIIKLLAFFVVLLSVATKKQTIIYTIKKDKV